MLYLVTRLLLGRLALEKQAWSDTLSTTAESLELKLKAEQSSWQSEMNMLRAEMKRQTDQNKSLTRRNIRISGAARSGAMMLISGVLIRNLHGHTGLALQRWSSRARDYHRAKEISDMRSNLSDQMGSQRKADPNPARVRTPL